MQPQALTVFRFFRTLILAEAGFALLGVGLSFSWENNPTDETSISIVGPTWLTFVALPLVAAWIAALVGLWRFRSWARALYLVVSISAWLLQLAVPAEPALSRGENFSTAAIWLISGMVIGLMFFSPVAAAFREQPPAA